MDTLTTAATLASEAEQVISFAERVFRRGDGPDHVVPQSHVPNWGDRPARWRLYVGKPRIPLPTMAQLQESYAGRLRAAPKRTDKAPSYEELSLALFLALGPLKRKLDINWNSDVPLVDFRRQEYTRGCASGGGLYPAQLYVVAGAGQAPGAGVYHYASSEHALIPLRYGDFTGALADAIATKATYPYYLVVSIDFWMNCFKYHNFGYHVCCEDTGAMLACLHLIFDSLRVEHRNMLTFDDALANEVTGADGHTESVFAVIGLGPETMRDGLRTRIPAGEVAKPYQRSRTVHIPELLTQVHRATLTSRESVAALLAKAEEVEPAIQGDEMPHEMTAGRLGTAIRQRLPGALLQRKSAWNSMRGAGALASAQVLELLQFVWVHSMTALNRLRRNCCGFICA